MQIRSTAWTMVQLLNLVVEESFPITAVSPWRNKQPLTAGLVAQWLRMKFTGLSFLDGFNRKFALFTFPEQRSDPRLRVWCSHLHSTACVLIVSTSFVPSLL